MKTGLRMFRPPARIIMRLPPIIIGTPHETVTVLTKQDWTRTSGSGWGRSGKVVFGSC